MGFTTKVPRLKENLTEITVPGTLFQRLIFTYSLILLIGGVGSWWLADGLFSSTLEKRLAKQLENTNQLLARGEIPHTAGLLQRISNLMDADFILSDDQGRIQLSTLLEGSSITANVLRNTTSQPSVSRTLILDGQEYLLVQTRVIQRKQQHVALVSALAALSDIHSTSRQLAYWLSIGAVCFLLLLAWSGHLISRRITVPLGQLAKMAQQIASGKRDVQVAIPAQREIGELANALNIMSRELEQFESRIAEQSRMATLGEMTSRIAHEIRNPLTALKMQMQLLQEGCNPREVQLVDGLLKEVRRLELIVGTTLQHRQREKPQFQPTQLNGMIREIVDLIRPQFEHQNICIDSRLDVDLPMIDLDRNMLQQVMLNLLMNAKDELPEGGSIRLETQLSQDNLSVAIKVHDDGAGIDESDRNRLFAGSKSSKPGGFGLGLQLSRELIELHYGTIGVDESPLGGACFIIILPVRNSG